ncbi:MAG: RagB/SusD family nutrient uptake outer membrane protein, partial [Mangrovibacterium sp.]
MKNMYKKIAVLSGKILIVTALIIVSGCSEDFLDPDPLSFYEPTKTFSTESGLESALAMADRHLRTYWSYYSTQDLSLPISSEYMFSDLAVAGKTDDGNIFIDIATRLTPSDGLHNNNTNRLSYFWGETYTGIKYANTVISFIDDVEGMDEAIKNEFRGRAYFHRAFRYLALSFQFKDVPLVTKILEVPKTNYQSTRREAILEKITEDMEKAVQWVPEQSEMELIGMINKGACRQLLIKCYLATGQWDKAIAEAD